MCVYLSFCQKLVKIGHTIEAGYKAHLDYGVIKRIPYLLDQRPLLYKSRSQIVASLQLAHLQCNRSRCQIVASVNFDPIISVQCARSAGHSSPVSMHGSRITACAWIMEELEATRKKRSFDAMVVSSCKPHEMCFVSTLCKRIIMGVVLTSARACL